MSRVSWITTLVPLAIALGQTVKSFVTGSALTEQEIQLVEWLIMAFVGSGAIGAGRKILSR